MIPFMFVSNVFQSLLWVSSLLNKIGAPECKECLFTTCSFPWKDSDLQIVDVKVNFSVQN